MASEVDIVNLALANLGDNATVTSLYPPEGSAQSEHAARFYPIARDTLLEMHTWAFTTRRATLNLLSITVPQWDYVYAVPNNWIGCIAILPPDSNSDYSSIYSPVDTLGYTANNVPLVQGGQYIPQPYQVESADDGSDIILTNQENAVLRYSVSVTDTTKFTAMFTMTLAWHLASMLAGPIIKGDIGAAEAERCAKMMAIYLQKAKESDSIDRQVKPGHIVSWVAGR